MAWRSHTRAAGRLGVGAGEALARLAAGVPRVVAIFGVQGWRWAWAREVRELVVALDADAAGQQQWHARARQAALLTAPAMCSADAGSRSSRHRRRRCPQARWQRPPAARRERLLQRRRAAGWRWPAVGVRGRLRCAGAARRGRPGVVALGGGQGGRWDWARDVRELVLARQAALRGKRVAGLPPAAYGGYKDASAVWAAGGAGGGGWADGSRSGGGG